MTDTAVDFLLENLEQLIIDCDKRMTNKNQKQTHPSKSTAFEFFLENWEQLILDRYLEELIQKEQVEWFYKEMQFLRQFLKDSEGKRNEQEVKDLVARIRDVTHEVENSFDFFAFFASMKSMLEVPIPVRRVNRVASSSSMVNIVASSSSMVNIPIPWNEILATSKIKLNNAITEINSIKEELMKIYKWNMYGIGEPQIGKSSHQRLLRATSPIIEELIIVGFVDDTTKILELLTICENQRKVIPIIGMAGLGKTTLANKVYNDPTTKYHFYKQAWSYVSQVYHKRDLLLSIFTSAQIQLPSNVDQLNDDQLGGELYKRLKGYRYLIVLDDLWNSEAWDDLKRYFPNDNNGSRIMFTSRNVNVAEALDAEPYNLHFLNDEESWDLLQIRAFRKEGCPTDLIEIGKIIAKKCRGLPLAIVVLSGLLAKKDKTQDWWSYVAENISSYIVSDLEQYMDTLALSYNNLPHHLQPCFLYFGAFPEDYEIHVRQLIWLWVAEGFIRQNGQNDQKSLEELAEDYLMDLIDRSLVIVSRKRSNGGVKACRVHDLLRDLCLRKAHEENFLRQIPWYKGVAASSNPVAHQQRRMCIHDNLVGYTSSKHYELHIRSFLSFGRSL
ncbi:disease resistance protein RPP13-like [Cornus florida]|uniref:disease resistance protein RPP13-like n=1 Tax=Cornus florida TaxID=4283 RepID=UPI002899CDD2|nr:disease resistance protein RPP13-like [Cornus florida]